MASPGGLPADHMGRVVMVNFSQILLNIVEFCNFLRFINSKTGVLLHQEAVAAAQKRGAPAG
jgi:hypothetical protein